MITSTVSRTSTSRHLAEEAFAQLPARFQRLCDGVVVRVEDFPDQRRCARWASRALHLLGLFRGIGLAQDGASPTTGQFPNMIWLYRRPILAVAGIGSILTERSYSSASAAVGKRTATTGPAALSFARPPVGSCRYS